MSDSDQKGKKPTRPPVNPLKSLNEAEETIFRLDAANNFALSGRVLSTMIAYSHDYIKEIRARPHYRWHRHRFEQSAIEVLEEATLEAAKAMKKLLKSDDERIVYMAASTILNPTQEGLKRAAILKAMANAAGQSAANQPTQVTYETEWGSTEEPKTPGIDTDNVDSEPNA